MAKPPAREVPVRAANTVASTCAAAVDHRTPGVARADAAAQRGDAAQHVARAVGVLGGDRLRLAHAARLGVQRAVQRVAQDRRRASRAGPPGPTPVSAADSPGTLRMATSLCGSNRTACAARPGPTPPTWTAVSVSPATTWALVTTRPGAPHPSAALHPEPAGGAEHADDAAGGPLHPRAGEDPGDGDGTSAAGPWTDGIGSNRASALRIGPDGGSSPSSARRMVEPWMSARSGRELEASSATAPMIQAIPRPTHAVSAAPSRPSTVRSPGDAQRRPHPGADALQAAGEHAAGQQARRAGRTAARRAIAPPG